MYCLKKVSEQAQYRVQLMGSGTILNEVIAAAELLAKDFQVGADIWSVTSFNLLARDGQDNERWNRLHPNQTPRVSYVTTCLDQTKGPIIAATDYVKLFAEQLRAFIPR